MAEITRNPVLNREVKERMRRKGTPAIVTLFLLALTGVFWVISKALIATSEVVQCFNGRCTNSGPSLLQNAAVGRQLFQGLLFVVLIMVCFIVPALTSGAIAGERERQTLLPLQITLLRPVSILIGKLGSSLAFMIFLILAALPLVGATFVIGGVKLTEVLLTTAMVILSAIMLGATSLMCSTFIKKSQSATVASYGIAFILVVGTAVPMSLLPLFFAGNPVRPYTTLFLAVNPFVATASVLNSGESMINSPFGSVASAIQNANRTQAHPGIERLLGKVPFWILALIGISLVTVGAVALAARKLRTPADEP